MHKWQPLTWALVSIWATYFVCLSWPYGHADPKSGNRFDLHPAYFRPSDCNFEKDYEYTGLPGCTNHPIHTSYPSQKIIHFDRFAFLFNFATFVELILDSAVDELSGQEHPKQRLSQLGVEYDPVEQMIVLKEAPNPAHKREIEELISSIDGIKIVRDSSRDWDLSFLANNSGICSLTTGTKTKIKDGFQSLLTLDISGRQVDLTSLSGRLQPESLSVSSSESVTGWEKLDSLRRLEKLTLRGKGIDLSELSKLPSLKKLWLDRIDLPNLSPLTGLPSLKHLRISRCKSLGSFKGLELPARLLSLAIVECSIDDFGFLKHQSALVDLELVPDLSTQVVSGNFLDGMEKLQFLTLSNIKNLRLSKKKMLYQLSIFKSELSSSEVSDLLLLRNLESLRLHSVAINQSDLALIESEFPFVIVTGQKKARR